MGSQCKRYGVSAGFEDETGEDKRRGKSRGEKEGQVEFGVWDSLRRKRVGICGGAGELEGSR